MASFLELCQKVARESGTISGTQPSSVSGQSGRLLKIVNWTADAWVQIQNLHASWRWMREEFPATAVTSSGTKRYTAASWNITDHAEWITEEHSVTLYDQSTGVSDEGEIAFIEWMDWRRMYDRGSQSNNRPIHYTISPAGEFCVGPTPDDTYVVRGEYRTTPQVLSANADTPNAPSRFHDIIVWKAVLLLGQHDEATPMAVGSAQVKYAEFLSALERDQLPRIAIGAPLA